MRALTHAEALARLLARAHGVPVDLRVCGEDPDTALNVADGETVPVERLARGLRAEEADPA